MIQIYRNILNENSETLQSFIKDINKWPICSSEEQIELAKKAKNGDLEARDKLVLSNTKFVITCAKQYTNQGVPLLDLIQSGISGLIMSIDNFDPDRGIKFLSFAVWYIRREIVKSIYNNGRTIRYPVTYISKITKVKKAIDEFIAKNEREPNDEELIYLTNLSQKQYDSVLLNKSICMSIDTPITDDEKNTIYDVISSESDTKKLDDKDTINACLGVLNKREREVITKFYGLDGDKEMSIKELSAIIGVGEERVRQLRKSGVKKLRDKCGNVLKTLL